MFGEGVELGLVREAEGTYFLVLLSKRLHRENRENTHERSGRQVDHCQNEAMTARPLRLSRASSIAATCRQVARDRGDGFPMERYK